MALDSLRDFIAAIDWTGELVRVAHPVRARLEIAEIADRCMKSPGGGPALLFEHVLLDDGRRSEWPVAINLFGSMRRMCLALGVEQLDDAGDRCRWDCSGSWPCCRASPRWPSSRPG